MARKLFYLLYLLSAPVLCMLFTTTVKAEPRAITLAYLENGLPDLKNNDEQVALQLLANELIKDTDFSMKIRAVFSYNEMQRLISSAEIDYMIINSYHYLKHSKVFQSSMIEPIWSIQRGLLDKENYILVTQKRYADQTIKNFRGRTLSFYKQHLLLSFYLDYLVRQAEGLSKEHFFSKLKPTKTGSQGVLDVYFGNSDLCIVPKHVYNLALELNPSLSEHLVIIHESGPIFLPALVFSFKHLNKNTNQLISANLLSLDKSVRGEQILSMFNIHAIKPISKKQLQPMQTLYKQYQSLLK